MKLIYLVASLLFSSFSIAAESDLNAPLTLDEWQDIVAKLPASNPVKGQKLFSDKSRIARPACDQCHTELAQERHAPIVDAPLLAGQPKEYLIKMLLDYRDGRANGAMSYYAEGLTNSDIVNIAEWLANQPKPKVSNADLWQPPIVKGNRSELLSGCESCHGVNGKGVRTVPALMGQKEQYLLDQLQQFKEGARPDTNQSMSRIAKLLSDEEIHQLAAYFSRLTHSSN